MKWIIFLTVILINVDVYAACDQLNLGSISSSYSLNVNKRPRINLTVNRNSTSNSCNYYVGISKGSSTSYKRNLFGGGSQIPVQHYKDYPLVDILKDIPEADSVNDVLYGRFVRRGDRSKSHNYRTVLSVPAQVLPGGLYTDSFTVNLYEGEVGKKSTLKDAKTVTYTYNMPKLIALSVVSRNAPFNFFDTVQTMNFGVLGTGDQRDCDVVILSNAGYNLKFSSNNDGKLKHLTRSSYVDYQIEVNNTIVNLNGSSVNPVLVAQDFGVTPLTGARVPIEVVISDASNKLAGEYNDVITITVETNL